MKVEPPRPPTPPRSVRRAEGGFTPSAAASPGQTSAAAASRGPAAPHAATPALASILALQVEERGARRERQIGRGKRALAALDRLNQALTADPARLSDAIADLQLDGEDALDPTGEPALDAVLLEIETRRAVEMAKLEVARAARRAS